MRYTYSLRTVFVIVLFASVAFAIMRWLGTPAAADARFYLKNGVLHAQCDVAGKEAALGRILVLNETNNAELWRFICVGNSTRQVDVVIGANTSNNFGEGSGELNIDQFQSLKIVFQGFYVPLWPPAVSGWTTTYRLDLKGGEVKVIEKTNQH